MGLASGELDAGSARGFALVADVLAAELEAWLRALSSAPGRGGARLGVRGDVADVEVRIFGDILLVHAGEVDEVFLLGSLEDEERLLDELHGVDGLIAEIAVVDALDEEKVEEEVEAFDQSAIVGTKVPVVSDTENDAAIFSLLAVLRFIGQGLKSLSPASLFGSRKKAVR